MVRKGDSNYNKFISKYLIIIIGLYVMVQRIKWYLLITLFLISDEAYTIATIIDNAQMILVLGDVLGLTKKPNPCKLVLPANSRSTFRTTISSYRN